MYETLESRQMFSVAMAMTTGGGGESAPIDVHAQYADLSLELDAGSGNGRVEADYSWAYLLRRPQHSDAGVTR